MRETIEDPIYMVSPSFKVKATEVKAKPLFTESFIAEGKLPRH